MKSLTVLQNDHVRLEPLSVDHVDALTRAATADRSTYDLTPVPRSRDEMAEYVRRALVDPTCVPYAIVTMTGVIIGAARLMSLEWWAWPASSEITIAGEPRVQGAQPPDVAEIGAVWIVPSAQGTTITPAVCHLLMKQAFDVWRVHRLFFKTDERNARSRAAITKLGATFEGILRAHMPAADGTLRNTAMFSVLPTEWPAVEAGLRKRLESRA